MPSLYTRLDVLAPQPCVWQALIHKASWKYWNTYLYDCDQQRDFALGQRVLLSLRRRPGDEEMEFEPVVTLLQPEVCLQWVSRIPGLQVEQVFELQAIGPDRTQYGHQMRFSGPLTRLFLPFIRNDEQRGMERMARELKYYVENARRR